MFANEPRNLRIFPPRTVRSPERIFIGDDVHIGSGSRIKAITETGRTMKRPDGTHVQQTFDPIIRIGNRVSATSALHLTAYREITIEDDVMIASNVFIADAEHGYAHANTPYKYQGMWKIEPVVIRRGAWIGQNTVIQPGITIGEFAIVGANSVVTRSIPDRCIAVGGPARVIKRWDEGKQDWVGVPSD